MAIHLRPTGDAGLDVVAARIKGDLSLIFAVMREGVRPRPDQRHVAEQHVDQLRQLVEVPAPQVPPDPRDARVVLDGLHDDLAVLGHGHAAELEDPEAALVEAVAPLTEQNRAR